MCHVDEQESGQPSIIEYLCVKCSASVLLTPRTLLNFMTTLHVLRLESSKFVETVKSNLVEPSPIGSYAGIKSLSSNITALGF